MAEPPGGKAHSASFRYHAGTGEGITVLADTAARANDLDEAAAQLRAVEKLRQLRKGA